MYKASNLLPESPYSSRIWRHKLNIQCATLFPAGVELYGFERYELRFSRSNGSWDVKKILGEAKVYEDGSAMFKVPSHTPVYFQCIDEKGQVVQTMRSWSTLMPGETFGCVGCHEDKNTIPLSKKSTIAMKKGAQKLDEFYGPARGFSYMKEIQPIMDKHCIKCHDGVKTKVDKITGKNGMTLIDLTGKTTDPRPEHAAHYKEGGRAWARSYLSLTQNPPRSRMGSPAKWVSPQSGVKMLPPYYTGSVKSPLLKMLREGHGKTKLSREELDKICAWIDLVVPYCGDYVEANVWSKTEVAKYLHFQRKHERYATIARRNTEALLKDRHGKTHKIVDPAPRYVCFSKISEDQAFMKFFKELLHRQYVYVIKMISSIPTVNSYHSVNLDTFAGSHVSQWSFPFSMPTF